MRSQLRPRVVAPIAVLGLAGAAFSAFTLGRPPAAATQPGPIAAHSALPRSTSKPAKTAAAQVKKKKSKKKSAAPAHGATPLERALRRHRVVVVLLYSPDAPYDTLQTREARAGALSADAGFLAVDVSDEKAVASFATDYEAREAPALLFFRRGPRVVNRIDGYADRATVAQAVDDAAPA
jgi:hypothetical protein